MSISHKTHIEIHNGPYHTVILNGKVSAENRLGIPDRVEDIEFLAIHLTEVAQVLKEAAKCGGKKG